MSFDRQPLEKVLSSILSPLNLDFAIEKKVIVIKRKSVVSATADTSKPNAPPGEIRGRVVNENGEPLAGANVMVKGTSKGTTTNANGEFILRNVHSDDILQITYVGYQPQTIKVGNRTNFTLVLETADNELDETVIKGYYTTTRRLNTGSVSKVTSEEISKQPVSNPLAALEGRIARIGCYSDKWLCQCSY